MTIAIIAAIIVSINIVLPQPFLLEVAVRPTRAFGAGRAAGLSAHRLACISKGPFDKSKNNNTDRVRHKCSLLLPCLAELQSPFTPGFEHP
jgi:hypothetical protein